MRREICNLIGIEDDCSIGFSSALDILLTAIMEKHNCGPFSRASLDGTSFPDLVTEHHGKLVYCGRHTTLGGVCDWGMPLRLELKRTGKDVRFHLLVGFKEEIWQTLTPAKQEEQLYLRCCGENDRGWTWAYDIHGYLSAVRNGA